MLSTALGAGDTSEWANAPSTDWNVVNTTLFLAFAIACACLMGGTGIWRLIDAYGTPEPDAFDVIYGMLTLMASLVTIISLVINSQPAHLSALLILLPFIGIVSVRVRVESDSFRDQYRKFIELGMALIAFANMAILVTEMSSQWWISLVFLAFPAWALYKLIRHSNREQAEFQADSKRRDGDALDHTGREPEHDADN